MRKLLSIFICLLIVYKSFSIPNIQKPVNWQYQVTSLSSVKKEIIIIGKIQDGWHVYGPKIPDNMPLPISVYIKTSNNYKLIDKPIFISKTKIYYDSILEKKLEIFEKEIKIKQKIEFLDNNIQDTIRIYISYMACNNNMCTPPIEDSIILTPKNNNYSEDNKLLISTNNKDIIDNNEEYIISKNDNNKFKSKQEKKKTIENFILSLLAGLGALLTPCVYPMIPLTISYFLRKNKSRRQYILEALVFGLSIVIIYSLLGLIVALLRNPNSIYVLTTHWIPNIIFAIIFILFAFSFFGYFEIILPSSFTDKIDRRADKGGIIGSFFMALATVLLSFSCTGPFVAGLLIKASQGNIYDPLIGMFGFGLSFSIPFTLLAIFPSATSKLPKSGSWLNFIKITIAFILIASSAYFINKINQSYHLNAELIINSFITATLLMYFLYLIGKIEFPHDNIPQKIPAIRLILAFLVLTISIFLFFKNFENKNNISQFQIEQNKSNNPLYSDILKLPYNLKGFFDYDEALLNAKTNNKPILIDFVGHSCSNCKVMYNKVWSDTTVQELLKKFIIAALYVDDRTLMPESKWYTSKYDGKLKKTLGQKNADIQLNKFKTNALPAYFIIDPAENILTEGFFFSTNIEEFKEFLKKGLTKFQEKYINANN